jgi:hypothetical protein
MKNIYRIMGALALSCAFAVPAMAQRVIEDPGRCARFYPNANCQNYGPGNPYTSYGWYQGHRAYYPYGHHYRDRHHRQARYR